jgi:hypothetical protein
MKLGMARSDAHYFGFVLEVVKEDPLKSDLSTPLTVTREVNLRSENNSRTYFLVLVTPNHRNKVRTSQSTFIIIGQDVQKC